MFASKRYLNTWGFEEKGLWANPDKGILEYQKKRVLEVSVIDGQLKITYDSKWEKHFKYEEWDATVTTINAKLQRGGGKGAGKGKVAPE